MRTLLLQLPVLSLCQSLVSNLTSQPAHILTLRFYCFPITFSICFLWVIKVYRNCSQQVCNCGPICHVPCSLSPSLLVTSWSCFVFPVQVYTSFPFLASDSGPTTPRLASGWWYQRSSVPSSSLSCSQLSCSLPASFSSYCILSFVCISSIRCHF